MANRKSVLWRSGGVVFLGIAAVGLWWGAWPRSPAAGSAAPAPQVPRSDQRWRWEGVGSCSAAACHGGNSPRGQWGSAYTTWINHDPHARAFSILYDRRSQQIVKNLNGPKARPATKDLLCLGCHAMAADRGQRGPRFTLQDGVGCESCHGPAEKWLAQHHQNGWKGKTPAAKAALGMTNTRGVLVRAQVCVECHVGSGARDVNHDLIAAGHPRLHFEYGSYLAILPRHWDERKDRERYPDFEARAWAVGQVVGAEQALELLASRANPKTRKPWPEFAEYNCSACHHALKEPSWRQKQSKSGQLGLVPWGNWYFSDLFPRALATRAPEEVLARVSKSLEGIRAEMGTSYPNRKEVARQARAAAKRLRAWPRRLADSRCQAPASLHKLFATIKEEKPGAEADWDQEAQRYLALAALYHGMVDLDARLRDPQRKAALRQRATELRFPAEFEPAKMKPIP